jgi:general secretion pathway protein I
MDPSRARGFTLLEVLVALVIVAFGMGALMATLTSAADSAVYLREKSFAEWVALNRISEMRLRAVPPAEGRTTGEEEFAGEQWRWTQSVERTGLANLIRIDISVTRKPVGAEAPAELATASGFIGSSLDRNTGLDPDWSALPPAPPTGSGTGAPPPATQGVPAS